MTEFFETLKNIAGVCGWIMGICVFVVYIFKPLKNKYIAWTNKTVGTEEQNIALKSIEEKLDIIIKKQEKDEERLNCHEQIHLCTLKNRITNIYYKYIDAEKLPDYEKMNLIEQYKLYHFLNGNSFIDSEVFELCEKHKIKINLTS